jgi:uncharacterized protein YjbI with pentapeptide repeats
MSDPATLLKDSAASGRRVEDLDLRTQDLSRADLRGLSGDNLDFGGAILENSDLSCCTLRLCKFDRVQAPNVNFDEARLEDSSAEAADFARATLRRAHLTETSFSRAVLRGAVLDHAEGDGVEFRGADLRGASLISVRFDEADFRGADLRGADLSQGRFHSADFRGALLNGASMTTADCTNAWFDEGAGPESRRASGPEVFGELGDLGELLAELAGALKNRPGLPAEFLDRLRQAGETLQGDEPPEEWKPFLEPLMKLTEGEPSAEEVIAAVQSAAGRLELTAILAWLEKERNAGPSSCDPDVHAS